MKIKPSIEVITDKKLIGMSLQMSMTDNKTGELFRKFMPRRKEVTNNINTDTFDLRVYPPDYFQRFIPSYEFIKWAAVEVSSFEAIPEGMETFDLVGGTYAKFHYKGLNSDPSIFQYIFTEWLPKSGHQLADRPHFEIMGAKTKLGDPNSEEEIWIPIR